MWVDLENFPNTFSMDYKTVVLNLVPPHPTDDPRTDSRTVRRATRRRGQRNVGRMARRRNRPTSRWTVERMVTQNRQSDGRSFGRPSGGWSDGPWDEFARLPVFICMLSRWFFFVLRPSMSFLSVGWSSSDICSLISVVSPFPRHSPERSVGGSHGFYSV